MTEDATPGALRLTDGLGALVERLLKYSDIRRNDPRENREALRELIVGELADELAAVRRAERASAAQAMDVLRQIASMPRRTREQRLAKSCVDFLDSLREGPNVEVSGVPAGRIEQPR
jgi:hypothetical protein